VKLDQVDSVVQEIGGVALAKFEQLCARNAPQTNECLRDAVGQLVQLRDRLIVARRAGISCSEELCCTNTILSSVFGLEFPLGAAQWIRIREARDALKDMLRERQAGIDLSA
jgi:hypothetical protein